MPKKATEKGRQAALKQRNYKAEFSAPSDPPIVVSGGSVTITSKVRLAESYDATTGLYTYYTDEVTVTRIKTKGSGPEHEDKSDKGGKFKVRLFDN